MTRCLSLLLVCLLAMFGLSGGFAGSASAAPADTMAAVSAANVGKGPCSTNSAGGSGFDGSCSVGSWCAVYLKWVWEQAGVSTNGISASAASFITAAGSFGGTVHTDPGYVPQVGDAIVFNYNGAGYADHVGMIEAVHGDGSVDVIHGNINGVVYRINNIPASKARVGSNMNTGGLTVGNYAQPIISAFVTAGGAGGGGGLADGQFVSYQGTVYRIAGGAPIAVASWDNIGGPQPTTPLSDAQWSGLRQFPTDGTYVTGMGGIGSGTVFRIAGGAPIAVASWDNVGGTGGQPVTGIDMTAVTHAGQPGLWSHLNYRPTDGTRLIAAGKSYVVFKGAPYHVSPSKAGVVVDQTALAHAGQSGVWAHLSAAGAASSSEKRLPTKAGKPSQYAVTWTVGKLPLDATTTTYVLQSRTVTKAKNGKVTYGTAKTWLNGTAKTSGTFTGGSGVTYQFRAQARDKLGNLTAWSGWS